MAGTNITPWWQKKKEKVPGRGWSSADIIVRQHTRKTSKVPVKHDIGGSKKNKGEGRRSMDIESYRLITKIQKDEMKEIIESNNASQKNNAIRGEWQSFMKSTIKASKRAKGKRKSIQRREKKAAKEQKEKEVQEFIDLHLRLHAVDFDVPKLTSTEFHRYKDLMKLQHCFDQMAYYWSLNLMS